MKILQVLSLPMRNWNEDDSRISMLESSGFLAYLWGIETFPGKRESLKTLWFLAYLWGIETNLYSRRPQIEMPVLSLPMRNWNDAINTTVITWQRVLSLPMRNWNLPPVLAVHTRRWVLSLPMRNWNAKLQRRLLLSQRVLSLPMRNWNLSFVESIKDDSQSS